MSIAIVVLNFNGSAYIRDCLDLLSNLNTARHRVEIVVVDNNSSDGSVAMIKKNYQRVKLMRNNRNLGYAGGNNVGLRYAIERNIDWVWIVNPDVKAAPDSLLKLLKAARGNSRAGILGSKSYFSPGFEFHADRYSKKNLGKIIWYAGGKMDWNNVDSIHVGVNQLDTGQFDQAGPTDFITGASMFLSVRMVKEIGGFDEKFFLYYEENDLCQRAQRAGWLLWYVPESVVWHANAQATGIGSNLQDYYLTRNRLLFGFRWAVTRTKLALIRQSLSLLLGGRPWQKRGVRDFYLGRFGPGSFPIK